MSDTVLEQLAVKIKADLSEYNKNLDAAINKAKTSASSITASTNKISAAYAGLGKVVAGAFSIAAITKFSKECIELASNLQEVQNVVDVAFGAGNKQIEKFSRDAAKNFGLSELAAKKYASTTGSILKSMGLGSKEVEDMSIKIAGLTGDMASFYNLDSETAFNKLRSGLSGETEPLKQLGINMSKANLEQFRMSQGIKTSYDQMSEQERLLLRYNYILAVTGDAQGDFARTSSSWANQTRILALNFETLKATLGQGLINALTPALEMLNKLIEKMQLLADKFKGLSIILFGDSNAAGGNEPVADAIEDVSDSFSSTEKNANKTAKAISKVNKNLATFDKLNMLAKNSGTGGIGSGKTNDIQVKIDPKSEKKFEEEAEDEAKTLWEIAHDIFVDDWSFAPEFGKILSNNVKDGFKNALKGDWQGAKRDFQNAIDIAVPFSQKEIGQISAINPLLGITFQSLKAVRGQLDKIPETTRKITMQDGTRSLKDFSREATNAKNAVDGIKKSMDGLNNSTKTAGSTIYSSFSKAFDDVEKKSKKSTNSMLNNLISQTEKALKNMVPGINKVFGTYNSTPDKVFTPIKKSDIILPGIAMATGGITKGPTNALIGEAGYSEAVIPLSKNKLEQYGLSGSSDEEIALMREQNRLLSAILAKETTISSAQVFNAVKSENRNAFVKTGKNALVY